MLIHLGFSSSPRPSVFGNTNGSEPSWYQQQLQHQQQMVAEMRNLIEQKNVEIEKLKNENVQNQRNLSQINVAHEKVLSENRILKKAVSIQQERQNQAAQEVAHLRRQGEESNERLRRLEQMNRQLSFLLESSNSNSHGFMGFGQPPPDVY